MRRPRRKMTPRSYSRRIRTPEARAIATKMMSSTTIAMTTVTSELLSLSTHPAWLRWFLGADRRDVERQPLHRLHAHFNAAVEWPPIAVLARELGAPQRALHEDLPHRVERLPHLPGGAHHLLPARPFGLPAGLHRLPDDQRQAAAENQAD